MPGSIMTNLGGDACKNYYTYLYHVLYDKGTWFTGMNYPYGDQAVYADAQPILSTSLGYLKNIIPISASNALAIMHLLIGVSYVIAIVYNYKILIHFRVKPLLSVVFATLIIMMSPQVLRIGGHYGLSYMCVIPMLFYWSIRYHEGNRIKYALYIFLLGDIMSFFHPYFGAIIFAWVCFYIIGYFIFIRNSIAIKIRNIIPLLLSVAGIFLLFRVIMLLTDPIKDRPTQPWGSLNSGIVGEQLVTSVYSPILKLIFPASLFSNFSSGSEGYCYLGIVVILVVTASFIWSVTNKIRKASQQQQVVSEENFSPIWLFVAFASLILSMGVPFVWNMGWLLDYISILRQFRVFCRVSWIFYHIITIYAVVVIYNWYTIAVRKNKRYIAYGSVFIALIIWGTEANGYAEVIRQINFSSQNNYNIFFSKDEKDWKTFLEENHYKQDDFQALLLIPFVHIGSEKLWANESDTWLITLGAKASLQLHLPMVDVMMSRSSWSETFKQVRIVAGPYSDKAMLKDIKSDKPFLLLQSDYDSSDYDAKYLLRASDYIGHYSQCYVYACYPQRIKANDKKHIDSITPIYQQMKPGRDTCISCTGDYYINHFDKDKATNILFGGGAVNRIKADTGTIASFPLKPASDSELYEFSVWVLLPKDKPSSPFFNLELSDSSGNVRNVIQVLTKYSVDNFDMWFRASIYFPLPQYCRNVKCIIENSPNPSYLALDEMQLRPADGTIISKSGNGAMMINNHLYKK